MALNTGEKSADDLKGSLAPFVDWAGVIDTISKYVVKIFTPTGTGTGFLLTYTRDKLTCGIATAQHVVGDAHEWEQPIRVTHVASGKSVLLRLADRAILTDSARDTAALVIQRGGLPFPDETLELAPKGMHLRTGVEIGWLGYPHLAGNTLCFFHGRVSAFVVQQSAYLVDGVAINGVSGGPAFFPSGKLASHVIGVVSAYIPNRATGEPLPGLMIVKDMSHLQSVVETLQGIGEARQKEAEAGDQTAPPGSPTGQDGNPPSADGNAQS